MLAAVSPQVTRGPGHHHHHHHHRLAPRLLACRDHRVACHASPKETASRLLELASGTQRGLETPPDTLTAIHGCVEALAAHGTDAETTNSRLLSATWRMAWTTEKETLFIVKNAGVFGTKAGDVFQVIDVDEGRLQNVITFPPEGAFVVDSALSAAGPQRCEFKFRAAELQLPEGKKVGVPPFGQGWFDTVYCDDTIRVAKDIRGDTLVVVRDGPPRWF